jgi:hypothetical protein
VLLAVQTLCGLVLLSRSHRLAALCSRVNPQVSARPLSPPLLPDVARRRLAGHHSGTHRRAFHAFPLGIRCRLVCASERVLGTAGEVVSTGIHDRAVWALGRPLRQWRGRAVTRALNGAGGTRDYRRLDSQKTEVAVIAAVCTAANVALLTASQWPESELQSGVVDRQAHLAEAAQQRLSGSDATGGRTVDPRR